MQALYPLLAHCNISPEIVYNSHTTGSTHCFSALSSTLVWKFGRSLFLGRMQWPVVAVRLPGNQLRIQEAAHLKHIPWKYLSFLRLWIYDWNHQNWDTSIRPPLKLFCFFCFFSSVVLNFKAVPLDVINNLALVALPDAPAPRAQMIWQRWRARRFENSDIKVLIIRPPFHFPASN